MDAVTNLVAIVSLLLALAMGGNSSKGQASVSPSSTSSTGFQAANSGCGWTCTSNHNETLVFDNTPVH